LDSATFLPDSTGNDRRFPGGAHRGGSVLRRSSQSKLNCRNLVTLLLIFVWGCTPEGVPGDPVSRRIGWFSLVGGEDIRAACTRDSPIRYRFVYNAVYTEQVRVYDLVAQPDGPGRLDSVVLAGGISLGASTLAELADVVPGARDERALSRTEVAELLVAAHVSAVDAAKQHGLRLRSDGFYWTLASCVGGQFFFTAFDQPQFAAVRFPAVLFRLDRTGVPVNPPRELHLEPFEAAGTERGSGRYSQLRFLLEVGQNGLVR
jgi:hypothetical protein